MKRSIFLFVILLMATACALPVTAQNSPRVKALQKESTALRRQIAESEQLLRTNRKNVAGQLNNLAVLNDRIATQEKIVEGYRTEVTTLGTSIARLQQDLRTLETDLAACKDKYRRSVMYLHRNKLLQNKWSFILMSKNFRQMYRRMRYATDYAKYLRVQGEAIRQKEEAVAKAKAQLEADRADKDLMLTEARTQQGELEKQKGERQRMVSQLQSQQKKINAALAQQRKQQATLNARIERLIQEEIAAAERARKERERRERERQERERRERERREAAARAAAKKNAGKSSGSKAAGSSGKSDSKSATPSSRTATPRYESADETDRTVSGNFRANRGRLPVPITGSYAVTSRYGQNTVEGLRGVSLDNKGINLTGRRGAQARAVFGGEVTAVANVGGTYVVILRHGDYFSVYSNLAAVSVRHGQQVSTRQTLGTVATDASGNAVLHFQLRQRRGATASHIDPLPWIAR